MTSRVAGAAVALTLLMALAGCAATGATFSPDGPCTADGRAPRSYPDLESRLPAALNTVAPTSVDSGRNCSDTALGTLKGHGVTELRFAGAIWDEGDGDGTSIAVLALRPDAGASAVGWVEEFYESGARAGKKTENIQSSRPTFDGIGAAFRLDALNDLSEQTVIVWPGGDVVRVVIVATRVEPGASLAAHDERVRAAVRAAAASGPAPGGSRPSVPSVQTPFPTA